ncbi:hypothetical protein MASR1M12_33670 [Erysipelotrichia bacterium]
MVDGKIATGVRNGNVRVPAKVNPYAPDGLPFTKQQSAGNFAGWRKLSVLLGDYRASRRSGQTDRFAFPGYQSIFTDRNSEVKLYRPQLSVL